MKKQTQLIQQFIFSMIILFIGMNMSSCMVQRTIVKEVPVSVYEKMTYQNNYYCDKGKLVLKEEAVYSENKTINKKINIDFDFDNYENYQTTQSSTMSVKPNLPVNSSHFSGTGEQPLANPTNTVTVVDVNNRFVSYTDETGSVQASQKTYHSQTFYQTTDTDTNNHKNNYSENLENQYSSSPSTPVATVEDIYKTNGIQPKNAVFYPENPTYRVSTPVATVEDIYKKNEGEAEDKAKKSPKNRLKGVLKFLEGLVQSDSDKVEKEQQSQQKKLRKLRKDRQNDEEVAKKDRYLTAENEDNKQVRSLRSNTRPNNTH